jgi:hypothetical protein
VKNAVVVLAGEFVPELPEHAFAQVDAINVSTLLQCLGEKPSGSYTDFQNRAPARAYCSKKIITIDGAQVGVDGIVEPGEVFGIFRVRRHVVFRFYLATPLSGKKTDWRRDLPDMEYSLRQPGVTFFRGFQVTSI